MFNHRGKLSLCASSQHIQQSKDQSPRHLVHLSLLSNNDEFAKLLVSSTWSCTRNVTALHMAEDGCQRREVILGPCSLSKRQHGWKVGNKVQATTSICGWKVVQYGVCDPLTENLLPFPLVCYCYRSSSEPLLRQHTLSAPWRWHLLDPMENVTYQDRVQTFPYIFNCVAQCILLGSSLSIG